MKTASRSLRGNGRKKKEKIDARPMAPFNMYKEIQKKKGKQGSRRKDKIVIISMQSMEALTI